MVLVLERREVSDPLQVFIPGVVLGDVERFLAAQSDVCHEYS
jgi:hypothetical protein